VQQALPPVLVLPRETTSRQLSGFPAQLAREAVQQEDDGQPKAKRQKTGDVCKRCGKGGANTHSKLACLADGGPRPVSGKASFKSQPPGWPGSLGLPFPLPRTIFSPKSAELVKSGFTSAYEEHQLIVFADQQGKLTLEQENFARFVGNIVKDKPAEQAWITMEPYISWAALRIQSEQAGRQRNIKAIRGQVVDEGGGDHHPPVASSSRPPASRSAGKASAPRRRKTGYMANAASKKRLNQLTTSDEEDFDEDDHDSGN
jgi:hypothetical protein